MSNKFSKTISALRKERGISQKNAAANLGISQALLSHYERGIRECGLDFLIKAADYYGVSCDYLLGHDTCPFTDKNSDDTIHTSPQRLLACVLDIVNDLICRLQNEELKTEVQNFLYLSVYRIIRILCQLYSVDESIFMFDNSIYQQLSLGEMQLCETRMKLVPTKSMPKYSSLEELTNGNPNQYKALKDFISMTEEILNLKLK